jgi:uncharacterized repeat protein (TIGR03943 family)
VGLASILAVVTIALTLTGRLSLYINPDSTWFAVGMSLFLLVGAVASFALPLGAESGHGHDHGDDHAHDDHRPHPVALIASVTGGIVSSGVVLLVLLLPPASLSAEIAVSRDIGAAPLFAGADAVTLASTGDTATFGVGEWSAVFASTTNPEAFDGAPVELTGFVTPGEGGDFDLTRLVITHCVIDAQPASLPVVDADVPETGEWVTVTGTVRSSADGRLAIDAETVVVVDEPEDPYEY